MVSYIHYLFLLGEIYILMTIKIIEQIQPNPDRSKDFISHKLFWKRAGFKGIYKILMKITNLWLQNIINTFHFF
jgi:hypothetical protein